MNRTPRSLRVADRNDRAWRFIRSYFESHGFAPSYEAISDGSGVQKSRVKDILVALEDRGLIVLTGEKICGFVLADRSAEVQRAVRQIVAQFGAEAVAAELGRQTSLVTSPPVTFECPPGLHPSKRSGAA